jgi:glucan phosphoethanolaminetransferase (alkaline phosphatase superfamily)
MKKTELTLILLAVIALIMKLMYLPGSLILIVLSLSSVSLFYFYLGFAFFNGIGFKKILKKESYKVISTQRIIGGIGTGFALSISAIGILFKIQSYPGASIQLLVGLFGLGIVLIFSLIKMRKSTNNYYSKILKRVASFGAICVFFIAIPSKTWLNLNYPNNPEYVQAILEAEANPDDQESQDKVKEESEKIYGKFKKRR